MERALGEEFVPYHVAVMRIVTRYRSDDGGATNVLVLFVRFG
jgi:hypothetical protein